MPGFRLTTVLKVSAVLYLILLAFALLRMTATCFRDQTGTVQSAKKVSGNESDDENLPPNFIRKKWGDIFAPAEETLGSWKPVMPDGYSGSPDFVLGVPTIARFGGDYLLSTLRSLISNTGDYGNFIIVVYVGEKDMKAVNEIKENIRINFTMEYTKGTIQVISPPKGYYPSWRKELRQSFGDSFQRVKWRSKQVLDQIYLMMYSYYLQPKYYLMLEDDIIASKDYLARIHLDAESKTDVDYILLSYCKLGAIGKLFRRDLLPSLIAHFSIFWSDKPLDWLLSDYVRTRVCAIGSSDRACGKLLAEIQFNYKPSLFQHIGRVSSLPGKVQKLRDRDFKNL